MLLHMAGEVMRTVIPKFLGDTAHRPRHCVFSIAGGTLMYDACTKQGDSVEAETSISTTRKL